MVNFKAPYNKEDALSFLDKFLPEDFQRFDEKIEVDFKPQFIRDIRKIGEAPSLENLHIYEITHESENDPRVSLSKDSFRLLAHFNVRKALIFFVSKTSPNYRLSLVTVDLKWESGARVKRECSNPRRYSFFLGPDARVHTPNDFLIKKDRAKDTVDLLSRFDVEIVTKEFFTKYKGLFEDVRGYLEKDHGFKIFAGKNDIDIDTFAKKLLGQIVFCYFLQRKGWLGAKKGEFINKGDKDFMRSLFNRSKAEKNNFYNQYLEYLFYDSLNNRSEGTSDFYRKHFDCQIPFLNGGLFEPPQDYDWEKSFVHIPDNLFSNNEKTGILDVFDLYNFTVYEDDPIDREVSVDPEMLGKVFENLLPENLRKGQGAYYTPREIVHYMCQESLINYLATEAKIDIDKIRDLVVTKHFEEQGSEELVNRALQNIKVCDPACGSGAFLVGMLHEIVSARHILNPKINEYQLKKETIQNCIYGVDIDPGAVEIAKLRLWLSLVVDYELKEIEPLPNLDYKIMCGNSLLEELIIGDESIKLFDERLLILKECNGKENISLQNEQLLHLLKDKQKELFDLHSKNKLTAEKQKDLEREINAISKKLTPRKKKLKDDIFQLSLFAQKAERYFRLLGELHKQYFTEYDSHRKKEKREQIEDIELEFIKSSVNERVREIDIRIKNLNLQREDDRKNNVKLTKNKLEYLAIPDQIHNTKVKPYCLWKLDFFEAFQERGGFDVIIANPPYIGQKGNKDIFESFKKSQTWQNFYERKQDVYYYFIAKGISLLKQDGHLSYIIPPYFLTAFAATSLRSYIIQQSSILQLVNLSETMKVFESANINSLILLLRKNSEIKNHKIKIIEPEMEVKNSSGRFIDNCRSYDSKFSTSELTNLEWRLFKGSEAVELNLERTLPLDLIAGITPGIQTGCDKVKRSHLIQYNLSSDIKEGDGIFVISDAEKKRIKFNKNELKYIKPFYKNSDIFKWGFVNSIKRWIIVTNRINDINETPNIKKHLSKYRQILDDRYRNFALINAYKEGKWWFLYGYRPNTNFDSEKIINPNRCLENRFAFSDSPFYSAMDIFFINLKNKEFNIKYILSLLNSSLLYYWLNKNGKKKGKMLELIAAPLGEVPIKQISINQQGLFVEIVDKVIKIVNAEDYLDNSLKQAKVKEYERQINQMVYDLYGLTKEEIAIVEQFGAKG